MRSVLLIAVLLLGFGVFGMTVPYPEIDRSLDLKFASEVSPIIAKQLQKSRVNVLQSFKFEKWIILYVGPNGSDEAYLFYSGDPRTSQFLTLWSGGARTDEEQDIKDWVLKNAPGIPRRLAEYFAWHVTKNRDK